MTGFASYEIEDMTRVMKNALIVENINLNVSVKTPILDRSFERLNLDQQQRIRSLIFDRVNPKEMWTFALSFAVDLYNMI